MPMDQQISNRPPLPLLARRNTKRHLREFVVQFERHMISCERNGMKDEAVSLHVLVDDAVLDAVCSRAFYGRLSMDHITEAEILEALRGEAGLLDTVPSVPESDIAIKNVAPMKLALSLWRGFTRLRWAWWIVSTKTGEDRRCGNVSIPYPTDALWWRLR